MNAYPFYCSQEELALRHTAIAWLGSILRAQFPALQPLGGQLTPSGLLYKMMGELALDSSFIPILQERMRMQLLDHLRQEESATLSKEMLRSNAAALLQHRKEVLLSQLLQEEEGEELVSLLQIGSHIEPVPLPHAASIEPLRHLQIISLDSEEMQVRGKSRRVWTFYARIASSSKEAGKWMRGPKAKQSEKLPLSIDLRQKEQRIWTPYGTKLRNTLLTEWKTACQQLEIAEICIQGLPSEEAFPWTREASENAKELFSSVKACGLQRAATVRNLYREEEEGSLLSSFLPLDAVSPEIIAQITQEALDAELKKQLPLLLTYQTDRSQRSQLLILAPERQNKALSLCLETLQAALTSLGLENIDIEKQEGIHHISCVLLLVDEEGGKWAGPSLTLISQGSSFLFHTKGFGTLERLLAWQTSS